MVISAAGVRRLTQFPSRGEQVAVPDREDKLRTTLAMIAPGTSLRDGLERILRGNTGALIVLGHDKLVESLCTGGFPLDVEFSATGMRELAKMDGAVVLDTDGSRIVRAATQLMPDPSIPTEESGTRHRTAQRVSSQTGFPGHLGQPVDAGHRPVRGRPALRAGQLGGDPVPGEPGAGHAGALQAAAGRGLRHAVRAGDRGPGHRAGRDQRGAAAGDGPPDRRRDRGLRRRARHRRAAAVLQLEELLAGVDAERALITRDYLPGGGRRGRTTDEVLAELAALSATELLDLGAVARALGYPATPESLETAVSPRGYRLLAKVPRLPATIVDRLVDHFGGLQKLLARRIDDLQAVEGVGESRARSVRESLSRLAESSILERYV
jgi:diadenylate cyclase